MEKRTTKILSLYNFYICILGPGHVKGGKKESASASDTVPRSKKSKLSKDSMEKRTAKILSLYNFYICSLGPGRVKGGKKESASASDTVPRSKKSKLSKAGLYGKKNDKNT